SLFRTTYPSFHRRSSLPSGTDHLLVGPLEYPRWVLAHSRSSSPSRCLSKAQQTSCRQTSRTKHLSFHRRQGPPSSTAMRKGTTGVVETRKTLTIRSLSRGQQMHKVLMEKQRRGIGSKYRFYHLR